jgi:predicted 2-oxoglutarate/Fe(II)-dependent dioxygenase YbiX
MFGTLVITLPCVYKGGDLVVYHNGEEVRFNSNDLVYFSWVAFYSNCLHELKKVTTGHRVALVYNLVMTVSNNFVLEKSLNS